MPIIEEENYDLQAAVSGTVVDMIIKTMFDMDEATIPFYWKITKGFAALTINTNDIAGFAPTAKETYGNNKYVSLFWKPLNHTTVDARKEDGMLIASFDALMQWSIDDDD